MPSSDGNGYAATPQMAGVRQLSSLQIISPHGRRGENMHVRKKDLDDALDALQRASNNGRDYAYDHANGGYRLVSANGAVEISPRLPKREMYNWVWAYVEGIHAGRPAEGVD